MKSFKYHILQLLKRIALIIVILFLCRILFYTLNKQAFSNITFTSLSRIFLYGIRFDLATISMLNSVFIIFSLAPVILLSKKWYQTFLKILFIIVNTALICVNVIDIKFFEFSKKRLTFDIFNSEWLGNDFITLIPHFIADYWFVLLMFIGFTYLLIKLYPNYNSEHLKLDKMTAIPIITRWTIRILILGFFIVASRGGLQLKPLSIITAARYTNSQNAPIVLNSGFTIIKTADNQLIKHQNFFTEEELNKIYSPILQFTPKDADKKNIVLIILESFGKEYSGYLNNNKGYTPFLDSLMKRSLVFTNCFANGTSSIEALPSILSSIPSLIGEPFITSAYSGNNINGIASCLKHEGYSSYFYHGGHNGTMNFDNFSLMSGIEKYYGFNEYPKKNTQDQDGAWGIFDEPYLQYVANELNTKQQPFCAGIFTLSSHHPYKIPKHLQNKFPKGELINHESIGYSDYALNRFFETAQKMPWFKNTIFVLTADHTAQSEGGFYSSQVGRYAVPLIFYSPTDTTFTGLSGNTCSQSDIFPSLLDYLGYNKPFISFGQSLFQDSVPHYSISRLNNVYQIIYDTIIIASDGEKIISIKTLNNNTLTDVNISDSLPKHMQDIFTFKQAIIQQFNNRMIDNKLTK